jgi:pimeloyl-ACP methyl ester carboxylesterase
LHSEARPKTRVELFEEAGHALFVDEPERFNRVLDSFSRSLKAGSPGKPRR